MHTALWLSIWPIKKPKHGKVLPNEAEELSVCELKLDPPNSALVKSFSPAKEAPNEALTKRLTRRQGACRNLWSWTMICPLVRFLHC